MRLKMNTKWHHYIWLQRLIPKILATQNGLITIMPVSKFQISFSCVLLLLRHTIPQILGYNRNYSSLQLEYGGMLIDHGADVNAKAHISSMDVTPLDLTTTPKCKFMNKNTENYDFVVRLASIWKEFHFCFAIAVRTLLESKMNLPSCKVFHSSDGVSTLSCGLRENQ